MAPLHGLTLCRFAKSRGWGWGWGPAGGIKWGWRGDHSGHEHPHHPRPARLWSVLLWESTGPVPHGICHQDGDKVAVNCPSFLLPHPQKGCRSGMWP